MAEIVGTSGSDILTGTSGDDLILTNGGIDQVAAGDGSDTVVVLSGGFGYGTIDGGAGTDTLRIDQSGNWFGYADDRGAVTSHLSWFLGPDSFSSFEGLTFNSAADIRMEIIANMGLAGLGPDLVGTGLVANALLTGGQGQDWLLLIADSPSGTVTAPSFTYADWATPGRAYLPGDRVSIGWAGEGPVVINGSAHAGVQYLQGGLGNDTLNGSGDMDLLNGWDGIDTLHGNGGDDALMLVNTIEFDPVTFLPMVTTKTGSGSLFDGGTGTDFMVFGGVVNFQGTLQSIEGIYLRPGYDNPPGARESQAYTLVTMTQAAFTALPAGLVLDGIGTIEVSFGNGGNSFSAAGFVLDPGSDISLALIGGQGIDQFTGAGSNDVLIGAAGGDTLHGGAGRDLIHAGAVDLDDIGLSVLEPYAAPPLDRGAEIDTIVAGDGDDLAFAGYGDSVDGGADIDTLYLSLLIAPSGVTIDLTAPTLTIGSGIITGIEKFYWIEGSNHGDSITLGGNGAGHLDLNVILGMGGNDSLTGSAGAEVLAGGAGADTLSGHDGDDVLHSDMPQNPASSYIFESHPFAFDAPLIDAGSEHDILLGGGGDDILFAGFGDTIDGGADGTTGDSLHLSLRGATTGQTFDFATLPAAIAGGAITGIEHLRWVQGTDHADSLTLGNSATAIADGGGMDGFGGNDFLRGNDGMNTIAGGTGADQIEGGGGDDVLFSTDRFTYPSPPNGIDPDSYVAPVWDTGTEADVLIGGDGIDRFYAGYGDSVDGGSEAGVLDTLSISLMGATSGVVADFGQPTLTIGGGTITGIEHIAWIQGSNFADNLTFSLSPAGVYELNQVFAMGGDDTITAGYYTAFIDGGDGDDTLDGRGSQYLGIVLGGAGNDLIQLRSGQFADADGGAGNDTILGGGGFLRGGDGDDWIEASDFAILLAGDAGSDVLIGSSSSEYLDGGSGADRMYGGHGSDIYWVDTQADLIFEDSEMGIDEVVASTGFYLYANLENLTLAQDAGDIFGVGNDLANAITGNSSANLLIAWGGNDTVYAGGGNDVIYGVDGADTINGESGVDYVAAGIGNDAVNGGDGSDEIYGEAGDDILDGGASFDFDILVGGEGNDTLLGASTQGDFDYLYGNLGDDSFYVDTPADLVFEQLGEGTDTVFANIAGAGFYLHGNVENLTLLGETPFGVGNDLDNALTGNAIGNFLLGGAGNDTLNGMGGGDVLFGEGGADVFVFEAGTGGDVVGDFVRGQDRLDLSAFGLGFGELQARFVQDGNVGAIVLDGGDLIVLHNVTMSELTATDFIFG